MTLLLAREAVEFRAQDVLCAEHLPLPEGTSATIGLRYIRVSLPESAVTGLDKASCRGTSVARGRLPFALAVRVGHAPICIDRAYVDLERAFLQKAGLVTTEDSRTSSGP